MHYLICGLGNPGYDYDDTRHNVGFELVDAIANDKGATWSDDRLGQVAKISHRRKKILLLKPMTYMNRSGRALHYWMAQHKVSTDRVVVVLDDLNLPFGTVRLRKKGKDGGHNGLKDIDAKLGRQDYARLRIGIGDDFSRGRQVDYVLGKWTDQEAALLPAILNHGRDAIYHIVHMGIDRAMNVANKKVSPESGQ